MFDPIDHPIILFLTIFIAVLGVFFGFSIAIYYLGNNNDPFNYKYIDIGGNEGFAQWCNSDGPLSCYTEKGYVQVKEFHKND